MTSTLTFLADFSSGSLETLLADITEGTDEIVLAEEGENLQNFSQTSQVRPARSLCEKE